MGWKPLKLLAVPALALALIAAGCGDDDDEDTPSATTTSGATAPSGSATHEQWISRADEICASADHDLTADAEQAFGSEEPTEADLEQFAQDALLPSLQSQHDAIAALPKPEEDAEQIDDLLSALQQGIDEAQDNPVALTQGDATPGIQKANQLAQEIGLTDCGEGGDG
jgi:hypothetical protein